MSRVAGLLMLLALAAAAVPEGAKFRFAIFEETCFQKFFTDHNFLDAHCLKLTLSKLLGYLIVWGAFAVKLPQIAKILKNKSTYGISFRSVTFEAFMNCLLIGYNIFRRNPFSIYGENVFLAVQNAVILALFFVYPNLPSRRSYIVWSLLLVGLAVPLIGQLVPQSVQELSISLSIVIFVIARLEQILENHRNKSTGNLAFLTNVMNVGGNIARTFTVLTQASGDLLLVASNFTAVFVNGYLFLQFIMYWNNNPDKQIPQSGTKKGQ